MNKTPARGRVITVAVAAAVTGLALSGCRAALPPTDPNTAADFTVNQIASVPGAAFTVVGELAGGSSSQEILTSQFAFNFGPQGPVPIPSGLVLNRKSSGTWTQSNVFSASDGIIFPNKPTIADVNNDGRNDIIQPAGYFFSTVSNLATGSITWWENNGSGSFTRHDVVTGKLGSYHGVAYTDVDNDGKKDIVTTFEDGGFPAWPFAGPPIAPQIRVEYFKGLGGGAFGSAVKLADGGGSLPVVADINLDGKQDIISAQYFGVKTAVPPPFADKLTDDSFVWWENTGSAADGLDASDFTRHIIAEGLGESFQILPVDNIDGDGKYGAIAINHTNPTAVPGSALPQMFRLKPGSDIRAKWNVEVISNSFSIDDTRTGQAAPGGLSEGDLDGDGDIDLSVGGDADWSMYWFERAGDGSWIQHDIAAEYGVPGTNWGQGSTAIADLNRDGKNELVFSSFNANGVFVMERVAGTGGKFPATPRVPDPLLRY